MDTWRRVFDASVEPLTRPLSAPGPELLSSVAASLESSTRDGRACASGLGASTTATTLRGRSSQAATTTPRNAFMVTCPRFEFRRARSVSGPLVPDAAAPSQATAVDQTVPAPALV